MKSCPTCQSSYPNNYAVCPADGSPLVEAGAWTDGSIIRGKYRLLAKVGQGGMGSVYKALHLAFDEMRALKVIAPELLTDQLFVKRFKHEAVITRRLQHPNAVRVDDIDEAEDGRPYIVMEFIDGKSLKKLIREEGPLPVERVLSIIRQSALALEAAHKLGMVHRDIKPDNIALVDTPDGEMVKVLDFGIAKVKEARMGEAAGMTLTGAGVVIGTPQYMSPEQAMGKRGDELDGRADLYSLGVVMYQMLTADLPFKADTTMEMLLAHMQKPPAPIGVLHPELAVPEDVANLAMRLLEKNRDNRPASARALVQEIERLENDLKNPIMTRRVTTDDMMLAGDNRGAGAMDPGSMPGRQQPPAPPPVRPQQQSPAPPVRPPVQPQAPAVVRPPVLPPVQVMVPQHPKAPESRWGMWAALIVLLLGVGGGGLYIATRPSPQQQEINSNNPPPNNPTSSPNLQTTTTTSTTQTQEPPGNLNNTEKTETTYEPPRTTRKPRPTTHEPPPPPPPPVATVDPKAIKAKITMGNFHLGRGEYDDAIANYQEGLRLDPSNAELRQLLEKTITACKKENAILNEGFSCGGR